MMEAYIKSYSAFRTLLQRNALDYSLCLDSLTGEKSSVTVVGDDLPGTLAGQWLVLNSTPMWISTVTPGKGKTTFTAYPVDEIFNRQILYDGSVANTIGDFIADQITEHWIDQPDGAFATPYITVTSTDNTAFVAPKIDDNGIYNLLSYINYARQTHNIRIRSEIEHDTLMLTVEKATSVTHALVIDDGHTQLAGSSFSTDIVSKITVIQPVDTGEVDLDGEKIFENTSTDWYLSKDGTASTTIPQNRADGAWITIVISESDIQSEAVQTEFAKNGESHKVELYTDARMEVNDRFKVRLNGQVFEGGVIGKYKKSNDSRVLYKSGDLITTLQERVHSVFKSGANQMGYTGDGTGQMYAVGDIYITTRSGNPATLLGYGAWEQIQGRFLFAADSSHTVKSRGGNAEHTLTTAELPEIEIPIKSGGMSFGAERSNATSGSNWWVMRGNVTGASVTIPGESQPFSIMPPYISVYVWLRKE